MSVSTDPKPLVLVADDDVEVASLVAISLRRAGLGVITVADGSDALEGVVEHQPAACVLDIMMPNMNGYEVVHRVRGNAMTSHIPVVLLSARAGALDRDYGLRIGANAYVRKPFPPKALGETVWSLIGVAGEPRV
jgi:CheY-like chemotaxis protein